MIRSYRFCAGVWLALEKGLMRLFNSYGGLTKGKGFTCTYDVGLHNAFLCAST